MSLFSRFLLGLSAARELGIGQVSLYGLYRAGLAASVWKRLTPVTEDTGFSGQDWTAVYTPGRGFAGLPDFTPLRQSYREWFAAYPQQSIELLAEADEIVAGKVRLFGGEAVPLMLVPPGPAAHWSEYESGKVSIPGGEDIKFIWEPARMGWIFTLARAYLFSGKDGYAHSFWSLTETFLLSNPANLGPNWMSGQEVALRLIALAFGLHVFTPSAHTTPERAGNLLAAIAAHARRIPPTLIYARSQNNNHLITEAAGLYTAGVLLSNLPEAAGWRRTGWKWLQKGLLRQIETDGTYAQHSTNYHRLMLQAALWALSLAGHNGQNPSARLAARLAAASQWLMDHTNPLTGEADNLGANDGAYILPLAPGGFADFRPVIQAASLAFLGSLAYPAGPWDEFNFWLAGKIRSTSEPQQFAQPPNRDRLVCGGAWASLRAAHFSSRPSHADQLHVGLWYRGHPVTLDAGTFRYNAPAPWENALAVTAVHNTVTVDDSDQMIRAGKFLWLKWAQARRIETDEHGLAAEHTGYRRLNVLHQRRVECLHSREWNVTDNLLLVKPANLHHKLTLHWLLPNFPWTFAGSQLTLAAPFGKIILQVSATSSTGEAAPLEIILARAGENLTGTQTVHATAGWHSPTYNYKMPALSCQFIFHGQLPVTFISTFQIEE